MSVPRQLTTSNETTKPNRSKQVIVSNCSPCFNRKLNDLNTYIYSLKHRYDKYCWHCHRPNGALIGCISCFRVYHQECLVSAETGQQLQTAPTNWFCEECVAYNNRKMDDPNELNRLLDYLLKNVFNEKSYDALHEQFGNQVRSNEKITKPMDIPTIGRKIMAKEYESIYGFLTDVKLVQHCAEIVFSKWLNYYFLDIDLK